MESLLLEAFERERMQHASELEALRAVIAEKDALIQRQRVLWEADTRVSDTTSFLYGSYLQDYEQAPSIKQQMEEAHAVAHETPHMSRVNRIMCLIFSMEQKVAELCASNARIEIAQLKTAVKEQAAQLARIGPLDKLVEENGFLKTELAEVGKKVVALEDYVTKAEEFVAQRVEEGAARVRDEYATRRALAHEVINTLHSELMRIMHQLFDGKEGLSFGEKIELQGVLVHHMDKVRLVLHAT
jgi:hypothetical protein